MSFFGNVAKAAKKVGKAVSKGASSAAKTVGSGATAAAKGVASGATSAAKVVGGGVTSTAKTVDREAERAVHLAKHSKAMHSVSTFQKSAAGAIDNAARQGAKIAAGAGAELSKGFQTVVTTGLTFGRDLEEVAEIYVEKGSYEIARLQKQTLFAVDVMRKMQIGQNARRFGEEVVGPYMKQQISGSEASRRLDQITGMDVRQAAIQRGLGSCLGIGIGGDAGYVVGGAGAIGIVIDLKGGPVKGYGSVAGGIGAIIKVGGGLEIAWAPSSSTDFGGPSVGIELGGAYYVGLTVGVSTPLSTFEDPSKKWELDSFTIGIPIGIGVEGALTIEQTWVF